MSKPRPDFVYRFDNVGSTSDEAKRLAGEHPGRVVLVSADTQTASRGSHGRSWSSPIGGAWFSLAVPMPRPEAATPVAVGEALLDVLGSYTEGLTIKHPNDILHRGKKLVGILCEQTLSAGRSPDEQPPTTVIVGVGINANFAASELGEGLRTPPTSLRDILGHDIDLKALVEDSANAILNRLRP
ncbi:MAG: biotin--[acetyl-CoA-carboxylase] ligase [Planctomycetota bacterium]